MPYDLCDSAFESSKEDLIQLVRTKLNQMNSRTRAEFVVELLERMDPELNIKTATELVEGSALQVI